MMMQPVDGKQIPQYIPRFVEGDRVSFKRMRGNVCCYLDELCIVKFDAINGVYPVATLALQKESV